MYNTVKVIVFNLNGSEILQSKHKHSYRCSKHENDFTIVAYRAFSLLHFKDANP